VYMPGMGEVSLGVYAGYTMVDILPSYHGGLPYYPGYTILPCCPSACLHVTDLLVHGVGETAWAQGGNNPWVGREGEPLGIKGERVYASLRRVLSSLQE